VPPPGSPPNPKYAEAYWHANSVDGRVPWGRFGGYETEMSFYRWGVGWTGVGWGWREGYWRVSGGAGEQQEEEQHQGNRGKSSR
jgi:hypothetical protein